MMEYRPSLKRKVAGFSLLFLGAARHGAADPPGRPCSSRSGLFVLRHQYAWAHHSMEWLRRRWPRQVDGVEATEARLIAWFRRQGAKLGWVRSG